MKVIVVVTVTREHLAVIDDDEFESVDDIEQPWKLCRDEEVAIEYDVRLADRHDLVDYVEAIDDLREQGLLKNDSNNGFEESECPAHIIKRRDCVLCYPKLNPPTKND